MAADNVWHESMNETDKNTRLRCVVESSDCGINFFHWVSHDGNALDFMMQKYEKRTRLLIFCSTISNFVLNEQPDARRVITEFKRRLVPERIKTRILLEIKMSTKINIFCLVRQLLSPKIQMTRAQEERKKKLFYQFPVLFDARSFCFIASAGISSRYSLIRQF